MVNTGSKIAISSVAHVFMYYSHRADVVALGAFYFNPLYFVHILPIFFAPNSIHAFVVLIMFLDIE